MKFLHTADWQIGMRAAHIGKRSADVRSARLETAQRLVALARQRGADAMLVTGDTFEDNAVHSSDIQRVADILHAFGGPVYVIPGNHDPAVAASLWRHPSWNRPNLHLLLDAVPFEAAPGVTLFPCPLKTKASSEDPTAWIADASGDGVRIGLAHGTVQSASVVEDVFPIARDAALRGRLDYLALGHWHSTASFDEPIASARMAYAGTHETTKFGERNSGNVLLVDVDGHGALPRIEEIRTGSLEWLSISRDISSEIDLEKLIAEIDAVVNPAATLVSISLSGVLRPAALEKLSHLRDLLEGRFTMYAALDDSGLHAEPADTTWIDQLPIGLMRNVAEALLTTSTSDPEAARLALIRLYAHISKEGYLTA